MYNVLNLKFLLKQIKLRILFFVFRYEIENCQVIWAIKDKSVGATFFDAGAAHFFLPCFQEAKQEDNEPSKRLRYTSDGGVFFICL